MTGHHSTEGVANALAGLWNAIASKFRRSPEYTEVYLYEQAYLEDTDHLQRMADKFARRGRTLRHFSWWTLFGSLIVIVVGIVVFLVPTRFTDADATRKELDAAMQVKGGLLTGEAKAEVEYLQARDLYNLYGLFYEIRNSLKNYQFGADLDGSDFYQRRLTYGDGASRQLASKNPIKQRFNFEFFQWHSEKSVVTISSEAFVAAANELTLEGISPSRLAAAFDDLNRSIGDSENEPTAVKNLIRELDKYETAYLAAQAKQEALLAELGEDAKAKLQTVEQLMAAEKRISDALLSVNRGNTIWASQPWATLIAIRIGIVVLLLYLTTVLLATYRYTLTLAAYYVARADALQLLSHQPKNRLIDVEEMKSLVPLLSPDAYRIDKESVPYDSLSQLPQGQK